MARRKKVVEAAIVPVTGTEGFEKMAEYHGIEGIYEIFGIKTEEGIGPLVETEFWRLFISKSPSGQVGLMKVNRLENPEAYFMLERETRVLRTLQTIAEQIDNEIERPSKPFHGANLPLVLETIEPEEGKLVVFLGYHSSVSSYKQLRPLNLATHAERIDMKSAAWLFGKLMKTLSFIHATGFSVGMIDESNVFFETAVHGVFVLDFSSANEEPTESEQVAEVHAVAKIVWNAIGGPDDYSADNLPPHDEALMTDEDHGAFAGLLIDTMEGDSDAGTVYQRAYELFDRIWPKVEIADGSGMKRQWHDFVTYPR